MTWHWFLELFKTKTQTSATRVVEGWDRSLNYPLERLQRVVLTSPNHPLIKPRRRRRRERNWGRGIPPTSPLGSSRSGLGPQPAFQGTIGDEGLPYNNLVKGLLHRGLAFFKSVQKSHPILSQNLSLLRVVGSHWEIEQKCFKSSSCEAEGELMHKLQSSELILALLLLCS